MLDHLGRGSQPVVCVPHRSTQNLSGGTWQATLLPDLHAYIPKNGLWRGTNLIFVQRGTVFEKL